MKLKPNTHKQKMLSLLNNPTLFRLARSPKFARNYVIFSLIILLISSTFWALLGSQVQQSNADQVVNPYMFETHSTFQRAFFPGQHTYLFKWPLFLIVHSMGETNFSFQLITVLLVLLTVGIFAYILYKIEHRPIKYGTLILAFSSVLMLIPAQPYAGALLPVNMAMIANRNLEYMLFIISLYAVINAKHFKSKSFIGGILVLLVLIATDKLFLTIALGGSLLAMTSYALTQRWHHVTSASKWFLASLIAAIGSMITLGLLSALNITHITSQTSGPYGFVSSLQGVMLGITYFIISLFTNFGANPAFETTYLKQMPMSAMRQLLNFGGLAFLVNISVLVYGLYAVVRTFLYSFDKHKIKYFRKDKSYALSLLLIWSSIVAAGAYILTDHYHAGDARYISITLFTVFIVLAHYLRSTRWAIGKLLLGGVVMSIGILLSVPVVLSATNKNKKASSDFTLRNFAVEQALASHPVETLLGDYWRVMPIRQVSRGKIKVTPLSGCTMVRDVLSSLAWQPNLQETSFAYLLPLDVGQSGTAPCSIDTITNAYGKPNASVVLSGSLENPKELLLFYDHGAKKSEPSPGSITTLSSVTRPLSLEDLPNTLCPGQSVMNIVAHQDDDLLFMNPDVKKDIDAGNCVRTVYVTAGDAGANEFYWLGREQGSEAAYSNMLGYDTIWLQRTVKLGNNQYITIANPKSNPKISLVFMRIPDGNIRGQGFRDTRHESLEKLYRGQIESIKSIYGNSEYTSPSLVNGLTELMYAFHPTEIRTQSVYSTHGVTDHSDHMAVSQFTSLAYSTYIKNTSANGIVIPIKHYIGYPVQSMPENITDADLNSKVAAFLSYARHDGGVCQILDICDQRTIYGHYLRRQYLSEN